MNAGTSKCMVFSIDRWKLKGVSDEYDWRLEKNGIIDLWSPVSVKKKHTGRYKLRYDNKDIFFRYLETFGIFSKSLDN